MDPTCVLIFNQRGNKGGTDIWYEMTTPLNNHLVITVAEIVTICSDNNGKQNQ